jgi:2-oxo-3-hexenedioate decarboxylase
VPAGTAPSDLARELAAAYDEGRLVAPLSARDATFDVDAAYAIERELVSLRVGRGHRSLGYKVGYANRALWRKLKLDTLVWAHVYDDTVQYVRSGAAVVALPHAIAPRIEPEIVFKLKRGITEAEDAASALDAVEWLALGFEIVDCVFPEWKFQPADFVAAYGFHRRLVIGEPTAVDAMNTQRLAEQLSTFTLALDRNGEKVAEGSGRNALRSPALCLAELASAVARRGDEALAPGDLVSSGSLTDAHPIAAGETWWATVEGLPVAPVLATIS